MWVYTWIVWEWVFGFRLGTKADPATGDEDAALAKRVCLPPTDLTGAEHPKRGLWQGSLFLVDSSHPVP